ncbi:MAG: alpha-glycosidase [Clostridiales bacterium]|nr:alpha-glycosidase [Clostridiales bacterium]
MNQQAILHIPMSQYAFGLDESHVVFRLRAGRDDLKSCTLIYGDRACRRTPVDYFCLDMENVCEDKLFDWWEITLETTIKRICYGFKLTDQQDETTLYYGDQFYDDLTDDRSEYFQLPYNHRADRTVVPAWMQDAIVYNIFPDSFATAKGMITGVPLDKTWQGQAVSSKHGGTIRGITENLPYIKEMGFNCIYMNPIFAAGAYHKYDLIDYFHIDPALGTNDDFSALVQIAHSMGIRVMIDGVFNHCGWKFYAFRDVVEKGKSSAYWDWFFHLEDPVIVPDSTDDYPGYECFGYERMMPKLATDHPAVQDYFCQVGVHWVKEYDIDGWRLDVANEVNDSFWRAFRCAVKTVKPDCALLGEVWETASHWLDGSMFDGTMNYDFRRHCYKFFALEDIDAQSFNSRATDMLMRYRRQVTYGQLNLLDSHDVSRFFSLCKGDLRKMKLAVLFQMTFVGMPCVFYGDEKGMTGVLEEEYRHPMPWENENSEIQFFYQKAIAIRQEHAVLRHGSFRMIFAESNGGLYHYVRELDQCTISIFMNRSDTPRSIAVNGKILWSENYDCGILTAYGFVVLYTSK